MGVIWLFREGPLAIHPPAGSGCWTLEKCLTASINATVALKYIPRCVGGGEGVGGLSLGLRLRLFYENWGSPAKLEALPAGFKGPPGPPPCVPAPRCSSWHC